MKQATVVLLLMITATGLSQNTSFKNIAETQNGFIGIGTKTPDSMLTVKGTIHTQEVLVDLDGAVAPDYVFEKYFNGFSDLKKDYTFLSLREIETFIKQNYHLPKIPSAESMENNGVSLKEMNLLLLEKIEELTLHTIEQQTQIDLLNTRLNNLESKN